MSVLFCELAFWMHKMDNGAIFFGGILAVLMVIVFIITIYRLIFYKVLIGSRGFYYQTGISNGKYYNYADVEKAWTSSGTAQNGANEQYCNVALSNKKVIRFMYFYGDEKAVKYLVKQANAAELQATVKDKEEYLIDGKAFGKTKIVVGIVILAVIAFVNAYIIKEIGFSYIIPNVALVIVASWFLFVNYLFF